MTQKKWLILLISAFLIDALLFVGYRMLISQGLVVTTDNQVFFVFTIQFISFLMKSAFYGIIIYVFRYRTMMLIYGIVSALALFSFMGYYISNVFGYGVGIVFNNFFILFTRN